MKKSCVVCLLSLFATTVQAGNYIHVGKGTCSEIVAESNSGQLGPATVWAMGFYSGAASTVQDKEASAKMEKVSSKTLLPEIVAFCKKNPNEEIGYAVLMSVNKLAFNKSASRWSPN